MNTCILIHFIVGILSAIFGYLLGRLFGKRSCGNCDEWQGKIITLEKELSDCKDKNSSLHKQSLTTATPPKSVISYAFDSGLAKSIFGKNIKENDLTVVEGIGPKFRIFFIKITLKLGNLYQTVVFKNVNLYLTMQVKPTEFTILEHGQSKQDWPTKENGKNYISGRKNWMVEDKKI